MDGLILFWVIQIMHTLRFVRFPETRKECCWTSPEASHSMMKVCVKVAMEANHRPFGGFHSSWSNRCVLKSAALVCRPCSPAFCLIWKRFMCVYMYVSIYIYVKNSHVWGRITVWDILVTHYNQSFEGELDCWARAPRSTRRASKAPEALPMRGLKIQSRMRKTHTHKAIFMG